MIPTAVKQGYAADICSYLTSDIGAFLERKTPLQKHYGLPHIPRPDLLVYSTNQCREVQEWFSFYARSLYVPIAGVHPPRHLDEVAQSDIDQVVAQFHALIPACEQASQRRFDRERFEETVRLSREAATLWRRVLETARNSPAPMSFFDGCIQMGPIVVLRGTEEAVTYYRTLLDELEARIASGIGAVERENCRLFWDGMPIWGRLRALSDLTGRAGGAVVASTYCNSWVFDTMDERTPFESTARAYTEIFINRSERAKEAMLADLIDTYRIDGVIFHDARTCFNNSNSRFGMPQRLRKATGVPTLVIEGDLCDLRFYSEGQTATKIEAFIEQLIDLPLSV
jgi:benzoyl-CoA reductase/2-hydroxyglutaryl-CoA dehydratase subunit BcrC/BadD/HgdB